MNERIRELAVIASTETDWWDVSHSYIEKFAELIIKECTAALFDESERLFGLYSDEADMQQAERCELCSEQCTDNIALIEKHFGIEE